MIGLFLLCALIPAAAVETELAVEGSWRVVHQRPERIALHHRGSTEGVVIDLRGRPGLSLVLHGQTLSTERSGERWPLVTAGYPDHPLQRARVYTEGPDLVVQLEGPPLHRVHDHPEAPADPVLSWVRLRPRGADWRIVLTGLLTLHLPARSVRMHPTAPGWLVETDSWGHFHVEPDERPDHSTAATGWWRLRTHPALDRLDPYPQRALSWQLPEADAR